MVLGFKYKDESEERQARYKTYDLVREFVRRFEESHGTLLCKELLEGIDFSTAAGMREAQDRNLFKTVCPRFVRGVARILEDLL